MKIPAIILVIIGISIILVTVGKRPNHDPLVESSQIDTSSSDTWLDRAKARRTKSDEIKEKLWADETAQSAFRKTDKGSEESKQIADKPQAPVDQEPHVETKPKETSKPNPVTARSPTPPPKLNTGKLADELSLTSSKANSGSQTKRSTTQIGSNPQNTDDNPPSQTDIDLSLAASDESDSFVTGRKGFNTDNKALLKDGDELLALIPDRIVLSSGETDFINIEIIGTMSRENAVAPFKMRGEASLSRNGQKVMIKIVRCIEKSRGAKSVPCEGIIRGIDGETGLRGDVYSPSIWANIVKVLGTAASQWSLSNITTSVTEMGQVLNQNQSNIIYETLSKSWQTLSEEVTADIKSSGKIVTIEGRSVIKVYVTKDAELW